MTTSRTLVRATALATACALTLAGCSKSEDKAADTAKETATSAASTTAKSTEAKATTTATSTATETATATEASGVKLTAENFHLHDGFVKAVPAGTPMTAVFGKLENHTDKPAHLVGFSTNLDAGMYQIHEVVDGKMQEKKGGIIIEPNSSFMLKPGSFHLMIMGLKQAVEAGSTIDVTLKFEDGATVVIKDVPARAIGAGDEDYAGDGKKMDHDHGDMKMGDKKEGESK